MKLGYSSDNRQDCTHCRFYLKDTPFQNDTAKLQLFHKPAKGRRKFYYNELSLFVCFTRITFNVPRIVINCFGDITSGCDVSSSHVMPTRIGVVAGIYGCGRIQQPCHPHAGMCDGLGSMAAAARNQPILI